MFMDSRQTEYTCVVELECVMNGLSKHMQADLHVESFILADIRRSETYALLLQCHRQHNLLLSFCVYLCFVTKR